MSIIKKRRDLQVRRRYPFDSTSRYDGDLGVELGVILVVQAGEHQPDQAAEQLALGLRRIAGRGEDRLELA